MSRGDPARGALTRLFRRCDGKRVWLARQPALRYCSKAELDALARTANWTTARTGFVLQRQGALTAALYLVTAGVGLCSCSGTPSGVVGAGDCVGDLSILRSDVATFSVVALSDMELLEIDRRVLLGSIMRLPGLMRGIMECMASRSLGVELVPAGNP